MLQEAVRNAEEEKKATVFGYYSMIRNDMGWRNSMRGKCIEYRGKACAAEIELCRSRIVFLSE